MPTWHDQRNWTDASYKTYSTPLALPFPVLIEAGTHVSQSIGLTSHRVREFGEGRTSQPVALHPTHRRVPQFTTSASSAPGDIPVGFDPGATAVLVELDARTANWRAALDRAVAEAAGQPLDARLVVENVDQLDTLVHALDGTSLARLGAFSTDRHITERELWAALTARASGRAQGVSGGVEFLGGTRAHFTELNRTIADLPTDADAFTFSITPQMHATNRHQLVESIAMQRIVAANAVELAGELPVHVGPITLRARFNAVATSGPDGAASTDLRRGYGAELVEGASDSRQSSPALTAWTIASAAALSVGGVASISYFESWGPRGTFGFPVQQAMDWLRELAGTPLLHVGGTPPTGVWILAGSPESGPVALVANISDEDASFPVSHDGRETLVSVAALSAIRVPLRTDRE